jgi:hypothetical protein
MFSQELLDAIDKADSELRAITIEDVQRSTCFTWAGRALKAYEFYFETNDIRWLMDAADYAHESLEHGALHHDPSVLDSVRPALLAAAARAHHQLFAPLRGMSAA